MVKLERIIGLTTLSNAAITTSTSTSEVFYAAGNCVVRYDVHSDVQKSFYKATKAVACLSVSLDGRYIAVGERGQAPCIIVWDISSGEQFMISSSHKHGIGCISFSPDSRYLISAGFKHDRQLIVWEWKSRRKISVQKLARKVNSIASSADGSFFVTCGDQHLKWWYFSYGEGEGGPLEIIGKPASILAKYNKAVFVDVKIGPDNRVYCTSLCGLLCAFSRHRKMRMFVKVDSMVTYSITLIDAPQLQHGSTAVNTLILVGCSEGKIRMFSAASLEYINTFPLPVTSASTESCIQKFPACLALCVVAGTCSKKGLSVAEDPKLVTIHSDRSMVVWNIADIYNSTQHALFEHHSACIWDLHFLPRSALFPPGTFATCSADSSIRIWTEPSSLIGAHEEGALMDPLAQKKPPKLMLGVIQIAPKSKPIEPSMIHAAMGAAPAHDHSDGNNPAQAESATAATAVSCLTRTIADVAIGLTRTLTDPYTGIHDLELPDRPQTPQAPRAFAVHPSGNELVCGDKAGLLRVYNLSTMTLKHSTQAHASEILTMHYTPSLTQQKDGSWTSDSSESTPREDDPPLVLLASAGRDRLIHIFDASKDYSPVNTLDRHVSPVTVLRFTPDGGRLVSCGSDHTMVFNSVNGREIELLKSAKTPYGTINGLVIESTNKFAITSGQVSAYYCIPLLYIVHR